MITLGEQVLCTDVHYSIACDYVFEIGIVPVGRISSTVANAALDV